MKDKQSEVTACKVEDGATMHQWRRLLPDETIEQADGVLIQGAMVNPLPSLIGDAAGDRHIYRRLPNI